MKEINQGNLDTAIVLGDAVCEELGICCETRGRVIFQIYKKLEEAKPKKLEEIKPRQETESKTETSEAPAE